jgi:hypothetical protein
MTDDSGGTSRKKDFSRLIEAGKVIQAKIASLADTWGPTDQKDPPSKWISDDEYFGWFKACREKVQETFGPNSKELRSWDEKTKSGQPSYPALEDPRYKPPPEPQNPNIPYLDLVSSTLVLLAGFDSLNDSTRSPNEQDMLGSPHNKRVGELLGSDPVAGNDAVEYFASQGPQCLRMFVPLEGDPPAGREPRLRFAKLCRRFGDASIPILCEALEKGGRFTKLRAASGFDCYPSAIANDSAERRLGGLLVHPDLDTVKCTMLALGYMGAYTWAGELTREDVASPKRGSYVFEKLASSRWTPC